MEPGSTAWKAAIPPTLKLVSDQKHNAFWKQFPGESGTSQTNLTVVRIGRDFFLLFVSIGFYGTSFCIQLAFNLRLQLVFPKEIVFLQQHARQKRLACILSRGLLFYRNSILVQNMKNMRIDGIVLVVLFWGGKESKIITEHNAW